jgi:UDP-3-O-[3-hydroxymyristoyl] glucosamine N-acyltransferase
MRVRELAEWLKAPYEGDGSTELHGVAPLETATERDLSFAASRRASREPTSAGCILVGLDHANPEGRTVIRVPAPRNAFARAILRILPPRFPAAGVHPTAVLGEDVELGARVSVGPGCSVGSRVRLGEGTVLHANVTLYDDVAIGRNCVLHSGAVIGADGFGYVFEAGRYEKFPQVGRVVIEDFVEIGANTCVDRAALGVTRIGEGSKLDNMVHVGHNCNIGKHVVVAAQTGFSGGVVVEDYAVIGGQVGIGDKARIESRAVLGSGCGILTSKIVRAGQVVWGTPARPLKEHLEQLANLARLPAMRKEVADLKRRLAEWEAKA